MFIRKTSDHIINGIKPQGKPWTLSSGASPRELDHTFLSAGAEREGGFKKIVIISIIVTLCIIACEKNELLKKPTVNTVKVENITANTITATGGFQDLNKNDIITYGFCWSTNNNPVLKDGHVNLDINSLNSTYSCVIDGLVSDQLYYLRAFASNKIGVTYGDEISFTTLDVPTLTTAQISNR